MNPIAIDVQGMRDKFERQLANAAGWAWTDVVVPVVYALRDELQAQRCCTEALLRQNAQLRAELDALRGQVRP